MPYTYDYPMQTVCADVIVYCGTEILLIKRNIEPFKGLYALPGGHLDPTDHNTLKTAERELLEETGIDLARVSVINYSEVGTFSNVDRDPRGRYVSVVYSYQLRCKPDLKIDEEEVQSAEWVDMYTLKKDNLAFDHYEILLQFKRTL